MGSRYLCVLTLKDTMTSVTCNGILALLLITACSSQQYAQNGAGQYNQEGSQNYNYNTQPPPQILTHKQALNHDGNFKYLFTADNGLAQGETIAPDGSRNGGYTYLDPTGKKISIKYTAGKEGFRILEGDHLPKAPLPIVPVAAQPSYTPQQYNLGQVGQQDDGQYRPQIYERPALTTYNQGAPYIQPRLYNAPSLAQNAPNGNAIEDKEPEYNDAPGKPHSFGSGYLFEFAG